MHVTEFIRLWLDSNAGERADTQPFLCDLARTLGVAEPQRTVGVAEVDRSYFEFSADFSHPDGTVGKIDLYKPGCFVLEAKQGYPRGQQGRRRCRGIGERESPAWHNAMHDARGQALGYVETLKARPPFLIVCDVGYCFDLYASFDGSGLYRPFPDGRSFRHYLARFEDHLSSFRTLWQRPSSLDPSLRSVDVTTRVAGEIASLARELREDDGQDRDRVASFLIRTIFTMFAQSTGLLPPGLFTRELARWVDAPDSSLLGFGDFWSLMRTGGVDWQGRRVRRFGGWLFDGSQVLPLKAHQLELLHDAARHDWAEVDPAIFGTLLEQALDSRARHARGTHYTPRSYVERLVRPTLEDPLRREWQLVRGEVRDEIGNRRFGAARRRLLGFHRRLTSLRVLDPACGSGNFLYVTFDAVKRLELEVLGRLGELEGKTQDRLELTGTTVTPEQFIGIEVDPWASELAELVLWVGYLQWQIRTFGGPSAVPEPLLGERRSVSHMDALLSRLDPDYQATSTRFGRTPWPAADFIVGNPPFLGNKRMRSALGDDYVDALRQVYPEVPASADLCMYWWHRAAELLRLPRDEGATERFGFITTNSVGQSFNRRVVEPFLEGDCGLRLQFAIPDHPWVDGDDGAAVRIAMTVVVRTDGAATIEPPLHARLLDPDAVRPPDPASDPAAWELTEGHPIHADLSVGPDFTSVEPLEANSGLCGQGVKLVGDFDGSGLDRGVVNAATGAPVVRPLLSARALLQGPVDERDRRLVIDFAGLSEDEAAALHPQAFERLLARVKPLRDTNRRRSIRELWWRFGWERPVLRQALVGLDRYIATASVSKHRLFAFLPSAVLPDGSLYAVASDDPFILGVLSSRPHRLWALAAGGRLGQGNDPTWTSGTCFEPFPFPVGDDAGRRRIATCGLAVDVHRNERLRADPGLTLTGLYNELERGEELRLARYHERLDRAVLDAYGLPAEIEDLRLLAELVEIQRSRAAAEQRGEIRWLRPTIQAPAVGGGRGIQGSLLVAFPTREPSAPLESVPWPQELPDRLAAVWQLLERSDGAGAGQTLGEIAEVFFGARRKTVGKLLDGLVGLGLVVRFERPDGKTAWLARRRRAV